MTKTSTAAAVAAVAPEVDAHPGSFQLIPIAKLVESPSNHRRKSWGDLDELAASIKAKGVLVPICVRPAPAGVVEGAFEIVYGHRRFRAAMKAGLAEVPALVRRLSDVEVVEAQVIENLQRTDVHPLEEAEGYEQLLASKERPYTVDDIAAKVGKSKGYIYGRMKLLDLRQEGREAFYAGRLSPSVALYLARVPGDLQKKALEALTPRWRREDEGPLPAREASRILQQEFMRALKGAPFRIDDAELLPAAGACKTCPKRSGAQADLFSDVESEDVCTDPGCYREKVDATWAKQRAEAEAKGRRVLDEKEAKAAFAHGYGGRVGSNSGYVTLDDQCHADPKYRTFGKLLGKKAAEAIILARNPEGNIVELLARKDVPKLLKAAGHNFKAERPGASGHRESREEREKREAEQALRDEVDNMVRRAFAKGAEKRQPTPEVWLAVIAAFSEAMYGEEEDILKALGFGKREATDRGDCPAGGDFQKQRGSLTSDQLRGIALTIILDGDLGADQSPQGKALLSWAGVDLKAIRAEAKKVLAAAKDAKCPKGCGSLPHPGHPCATDVAVPKKKGTCHRCGCSQNDPCPQGCAWTDKTETLCTACATPEELDAAAKKGGKKATKKGGRR